MKVTVGDINDQTPSCTSATFNKIYREDATSADSIASPIVVLDNVCSDSEAGINGDLSYSISQVNSVPGSGIFDVASTGIDNITENI